MKRFLLPTLCCLLAFAAARALPAPAGAPTVASNFTFTNINSTDGLPHQQVNALAADRQGRIWMATRNGLARYDGYSLQTFYMSADSLNSGSVNNIYGLMVDGKGRVWFSSPDLITRYDERSDSFVRYPAAIGRSQIFRTNSKGDIFCLGHNITRYDAERDSFVNYDRQTRKFIVGAAVAPDDRIYISTSDEICIFDPTTCTTVPFTGIDTSEFLTGRDGIVPLYFDTAGALWIGRNGRGLAKYDPEDGSVRVYDVPVLPDGIVRVITEDSHGNILAGTEKGIALIHPDGSVEVINYNSSDPHSLSDNALRDIFVDSNDNIWVASYFGGVDVCYRNRAAIRWFKEGVTPDFDARVVREISPDSTGRLWVATEDGGLYTFDPATRRFSRYRNDAMGYNVHSLCYDPGSGDMWVGTFRHGLFRIDPRTMSARHYVAGEQSGLNSDAIFSIARRSNGDIFLGTTQGLFVYNPTTDRFDSVALNHRYRYFCYCLCVDRDDNVWVGTTQSGIFRISPDDGAVRSWRFSEGETGFVDDWVTSLYSDSHGRLWIGTNNNGLFTLDSGAQARIRPFRSEPDLSLRTICSITEENDGNIWVGTNSGLYSIHPSGAPVMRFSSENGLPTNQFNYASAMFGPDSLLYMGTVSGLVAFNPDNILLPTSALEVHLMSLTVNNEPMRAGQPGSVLSEAFDFTDAITLTNEQARSVTIEYGAIAPGEVSSIRYQVWLEGIDSYWRPVGSERKLSALNLTPGTHRLHIRAVHDGGDWETAPVRTLKVSVLPPLWRSNWAILLYLLAAAALIYLIVNLFNRRRRKIMDARMEKLNQENINKVNREKMDFFTRVSHELKTPLSLIIAPLKQAAESSSDENCSHHLNVAMKHAARMAKIIDELITFNKVESGNFQFFLEYGNPIEFCSRVASQFRESAAGRDISLIVDCEDNGEEAWFSPLYVERISNNLLSNALKFTLAGGKITYTARIVAGDPAAPGQPHLEITVRDTGIGMEKAEQNRIFDVYYQTRRGVNFNNRGWGLGLFLVKRLVEIHKGTVAVESEPGKGSCFTIRLNVSADAFPATDRINDDRRIIPVSNYDFDPLTMAENLTLNNEPEAAGADSRLTILIVEDNEDLLAFLSRFFSHSYNVVTATNGAEGLRKAAQERIDLIVSDVMMPEMDGLTMCSRIKTDISLSHIPVILLTAKSQSDDIVRGYENGADAYVAKPFDPHILDLQVKNIIRARQSRQEQLIRDARTPEAETASLTAVDRDFMARLNALIEDNLDNSEFCVNDVISALGVSRSLLYNKMKSLTDHSIGDYIRKKRLHHACEFLASRIPISDVAYRTGFSDPNYFSKVFRREFGVSPTEYLARLSSTPQP